MSTQLKRWLRLTLIPIGGLLAIAAQVWGQEIKNLVNVSPIYFSVSVIAIVVLTVVVVHLLTVDADLPSPAATITGVENVIQAERLGKIIGDGRIADFMGRENQLRTLERLLLHGPTSRNGIRILEVFRRDDSQTYAAVIMGIGGTGKTTLARKLSMSNNIRSRYDGGIYLWDMGGLEQSNQENTEDALRAVISDISPEKSIPLSANFERLKTEYNRILSMKRLLIILDNPSHLVEMESFRPPKSSALLVITRPGHPNLDFLTRRYRVDLTPFSPNTAIELLKARAAPRIIDDATASQICSLCSNLPLAIYAAGTFLGSSSGEQVSPEEYAKQLENEASHDLPTHTRIFDLIGTKGIEKDIPSTFLLSYKLLSPQSKQLFPLLCIFQDTFEMKSVRSIVRNVFDWPGVEKQLNELRNYGLINFDSDTERYYLYDLLRYYASSLLLPNLEFIQKVKESYIDHYVTTAKNAAQDWSRGENNLAIQQLQDEIYNLRTTFRLLASSDFDTLEVKLKLRQLINSVTTIIEPDQMVPELSGREWFTKTEMNKWIQAGIQTYVSVYKNLNKDNQEFFKALMVLKHPFDVRIACTLANSADPAPLEILSNTELLHTEDRELFSLPDLCRRLALEQSNEQEQHILMLSYVNHISERAENLSSIYAEHRPDFVFLELRVLQSHIETCIDWTISANEYTYINKEKVNDLPRLERLLNAIHFYRMYGFNQQWLTHCYQSWFTAYPSSSNEVQKAIAANRLAWTLNSLGEKHEYVEKLYNYAITLADINQKSAAAQSNDVRCDALIGLSLLYGSRGDLIAATDKAQEASKIFPDRITVIGALANLYEKQELYTEAEKLFREALDISMRGKEYYNIRVFQLSLSRTAERQNRINDAIEHQEKCLELSTKYLHNFVEEDELRLHELNI